MPGNRAEYNPARGTLYANQNFKLPTEYYWGIIYGTVNNLPQLLI